MARQNIPLTYTESQRVKRDIRNAYLKAAEARTGQERSELMQFIAVLEVACGMDQPDDFETQLEYKLQLLENVRFLAYEISDTANDLKNELLAQTMPKRVAPAPATVVEDVPLNCTQCGAFHPGEELEETNGACPTKGGDSTKRVEHLATFYRVGDTARCSSCDYSFVVKEVVEDCCNVRTNNPDSPWVNQYIGEPDTEDCFEEFWDFGDDENVRYAFAGGPNCWHEWEGKTR